MKKILFTLLLLVVTAFADTKYTDIFDAYDNAKAQNKNVMIMLSMRGCPGCAYMKDIVFNNKEVKKELQNFVIVHLDVREDSIPAELKYFATPTFYFLNADEKILKRLNGGENAKDFAQTLQEMKKK